MYGVLSIVVMKSVPSGDGLASFRGLCRYTGFRIDSDPRLSITIKKPDFILEEGNVRDTDTPKAAVQ
jgi:hypothetical protein